eukprot:TRINITY_DN2580_c0_g1_i13.p1 TRINITY_DN2580_c0_g1~~TRINITY_DN2580_c0_g1_i13.p1  ORF type:complete len:488 (-),score=73.76 TRINITY_DN2580_c0_g1_i13:3017-4480(-)
MNELKKVEGTRLVVEQARNELIRSLETDSTTRHALEKERLDTLNQYRQERDKVVLLERACSQLHDELDKRKSTSSVSQEILQQKESQIEELQSEIHKIEQQSLQLQQEVHQSARQKNALEDKISAFENEKKNFAIEKQAYQMEIKEISEQRDQASQRAMELLQALLSERASRQMLQESLEEGGSSQEGVETNSSIARQVAVREASMPGDAKLLRALQEMLKDALDAQNAVSQVMDAQKKSLDDLRTTLNQESYAYLQDLRQKAISKTNQSNWNVQRAQEITEGLIQTQATPRPLSLASGQRTQLSSQTALDKEMDVDNATSRALYPSAPSFAHYAQVPVPPLLGTDQKMMDDDDDESTSNYSSARGGHTATGDTFATANSNMPSSRQGNKAGSEADWSSPFDEMEDKKKVTQSTPMYVVPQQQPGGSYLPSIDYGSDRHLDALLANRLQDKENLNVQPQSQISNPNIRSHSQPQPQQSGKDRGVPRI